MKPFLKWAGGKTKLLPYIDNNLPGFIKQGKPFYYAEPFVGGGSVFLHMLQNNNCKGYFINDANPYLIAIYRAIKNDVQTLILKLDILEKQFNKYDGDFKREYFEAVRAVFNSKDLASDYDMAALFIFLNKTCFNGLYRVNGKGEFNVPFNKKNLLVIADYNNLRAISNVLNSKPVEFYNLDYQSFLTLVADLKQDHPVFTYLDPPYISYKPVDRIYGSDQFNANNQAELYNYLERLDRRNIFWLMSNADISDTRLHFANHNVLILNHKHLINRNGNDRNTTELLITNYLVDPEQLIIEKNPLDKILVSGIFPEQFYYITVDFLIKIGVAIPEDFKIISFIKGLAISAPDQYLQLRKFIYQYSQSYLNQYGKEKNLQYVESIFI